MRLMTVYALVIGCIHGTRAGSVLLGTLPTNLSLRLTEVLSMTVTFATRAVSNFFCGIRFDNCMCLSVQQDTTTLKQAITKRFGRESNSEKDSVKGFCQSFPELCREKQHL